MAPHGVCAIPQSFLVPPRQTPLPSQVSTMVQNSPSSHAVPLGAATTTQVLSGPSSAPVLHTPILHGGVSSFEQSTPQGPRSLPPAPPPPVLLLLVLSSVLSGKSGP